MQYAKTYAKTAKTLQDLDNYATKLRKGTTTLREVESFCHPQVVGNLFKEKPLNYIKANFHEIP